ncbi:MAG: rane protein-like protein [Deltaproteobacteria bacterium]|nr:rane protein-like protein [Deltaproteobacteria bacterium]
MDRLTGETRQRGLRVVAVFEGAKGGLVLITGFGLLAFFHRGLHNAAEELVRHLHLNPARHYPRIFLDAAARVTDSELWLLALSAFLYVVVRFIEAFGLWHRKRWAAWFGALSGGVYIPVELFELARGVSLVKLTVLAVNLAIVGYLGYELSVSGRLPRGSSGS